MLCLKSALGSESFATKKFREICVFWVDLEKFMEAKIIFWLIRESLCLQFFLLTIRVFLNLFLPFIFGEVTPVFMEIT